MCIAPHTLLMRKVAPGATSAAATAGTLEVMLCELITALAMLSLLPKSITSSSLCSCAKHCSAAKLQHCCTFARRRSAWVGARGNNTLHNPAAPNTSGSAAQPAAASQQDNLQQQPARAPRANVPPPETTLRWLGGQAVDASLLQRLVALPSVWSAHDVIWSIQVGWQSLRM